MSGRGNSIMEIGSGVLEMSTYMSEERREILVNAFLTYGVGREFTASNIGATSGDILQYRAKGYILGRSGSWSVSKRGEQYLKSYVMRN